MDGGGGVSIEGKATQDDDKWNYRSWGKEVVMGKEGRVGSIPGEETINRGVGGCNPSLVES